MKPSPYGPAYRPLLALSAVFAAGAVVTLLPFAGAPWPNIMGYKSVCPFAPGATFGCALLAAVTCTLRARLVRRIPSPAFVPFAAIAALVVALGASTVPWAIVKASYSGDAASAEARSADAVSGSSAAR